MLLMNLSHMTSLSLDNFAQTRWEVSFLLSWNNWLGWLVGGPLLECWLTCPFISGLPQHVRHLLRASSRIETMSAEQLLTQTRAVMTDNEGPAESAAASTRRTPSESNVRNDGRKFACYRCGGPNHMAKGCLQNYQERLDVLGSLWDMLLQMQWPWTYSIAVPGKRQRGGGISISLLPDWLNTKKHPSMKVHVDGQECTALIDSRCPQTLVSKAVCRFWKWKTARVVTADGRTLNCWGYSRIRV